MTVTDNIEKRTLSLERTIEAPRSIVWSAWAQPEHLGQWWARGMPVDIEQHQFKESGQWKYVMKMPDGNEFVSHGVYSEIIPLELIESSANFIPMTEGVTITVQLIDEGEQTKLNFKVVHPTEAYCKQQEEMGFYMGWNAVFDALNNYVTSL